MTEAKKPFHEVVAEKLISQLKQGTAPWQKPWNPGIANASLPMNPSTGKRYRGINSVHLMAQGYNDHRWMTYNQSKAAGAQVRKGEKGTLIQYWIFREERIKKNEDGSVVLDKNDKPVKEVVELERPKVVYSVVFNAQQIDGLPPLAITKEKSWNSLERAENILKASGATIKHDQSNRAFYRMSTDSIHLPQHAAFDSAERYYATALHELGHWTGHATRLGRDLVHPFGSEGYAREELRAEIASMILGDELGIGHDPSQHVAYVKSWIKALEDDPLEIFRAAADAEKIQGFLLGLEQQQTQEQPVTLELAERNEIHSQVVKELDRLTNPDIFDSDTVQLYRDTISTFQRTAQDAGYAVYYSWGESELGDRVIRVNYEDGSGNTLPIHSDIVGRGKALTYIGDTERVPGTNFTSDNEWQSQALKAAFASMDSNLNLAAKKLHEQVESIDGSNDVKLPKNWWPNAATEVEKSTTPQSTLSPEQQRQYRAEKFILSNLDSGLAKHINNMNRRQLSLSRDILFDAQNSSHDSDFWQRNREFHAAFKQNWEIVSMKINDGYREIDSLINMLPEPKYTVVENTDQHVHIILQTNSAIKALAAVNEKENRAIHDSRLFEKNQIDLSNQQSNFFETLHVEQSAISQGLIKKDDEINVIPPSEAQEWYQDRVENLLESIDSSEDMKVALTELGPEPADNESIFLKENGTRLNIKISQEIAKEDTAINVPYKERNEAKSLGAKWDRGKQTWYVPQGVSLDKFAKWKGEKVELDFPNNSVGQNKEVTPEAKREPLAVPYKDREEAKAAGAKWDKVKKTWYADASSDMEKLAKWKLENIKLEQPPAMTLQEEVETALREIGCILDADTDKGRKHPIMDGEKHRITVEGDKRGEKSGFYIIHTDGHPAGYMQNNRTKEENRWSSKGYVQSDEEKALLRAQAAQKQAEKAEQQKAEHEEASKRVTTQLSKLIEPTKLTTYMGKKGLALHKGVFTDKGHEKTYIPAYDVHGKQWTMQYINEDGTKRFAKNARKEGCFNVVGGLEALKDTPVIIIAEGYATAASITEATDFPAVAAFDSGNLESVAKALKDAYPDKPIIIAGDDDIGQMCKLKSKDGKAVNTGREKATEVAATVGGIAIFPVFAKGEVPGKDELKLITPSGYLAHQAAQRKLEAHAAGDKTLSESEIKMLEAAQLSEKQLEILHRAERYTDFNDLSVKSSLGKEGVAMQFKAVINDQLKNKKNTIIEKKKLQKKEKKKTVKI